MGPVHAWAESSLPLAAAGDSSQPPATWQLVVYRMLVWTQTVFIWMFAHWQLTLAIVLLLISIWGASQTVHIVNTYLLNPSAHYHAEDTKSTIWDMDDADVRVGRRHVRYEGTKGRNDHDVPLTVPMSTRWSAPVVAASDLSPSARSRQ